MWSNRILATGLIFISHYLSHHFSVAQSEFAGYPKCAQGCLIASATTAGITLTNNPSEDNPKLCTNVQYLQLTAKCIGASCPADTLESIIQEVETACDRTNTPLVLTVQQLIQLGDGAASSFLSSSSTALSTSLTSSSLSSMSPTPSSPSECL
jgi:hypothetical protein